MKLTKASITELKAFNAPPEDVKSCLTATLLLLGHPCKDWKEVQKSLTSFNIIAEVQNFDFEKMPASALSKIAKYTCKETFNAESMK